MGDRQLASLDFAATGTPCEVAPRLGATLGFEADMLWIKRDDLVGLAGGGNKGRKLEYLCADALGRGADVLVTGGAAQSNHVRMSAAAAARVGLRFVAVLAGRPSAATEGNLSLDVLLGAEFRFCRASALDETLAAVGAELEADGATPYVVPLGGSSPVGAYGYVACADEIDAVAPAGSLVVCADGSGGTHAGLVAGFGDHARVLGVNVGFADLDPKVAILADQAAALANRAAPTGTLQLDAGQPEPYGEPTSATLEALELAARTEGLLLDPVYTGRALAALIARRRDGRIAPDQPTVFVHTGGLPGLLIGRYQHWFQLPESV